MSGWIVAVGVVLAAILLLDGFTAIAKALHAIAEALRGGGE